MKKFILVILILATIASFAFMGYNLNEYNKSTESGREKELEEKKDKLKKKEEEIKDKEAEIIKLKEDNKEKIEEYELWQEELKKVQSS